MNIYEIIKNIPKKPKTFLCVNFGCRVNAAETNQFSQILIESGFSPNPNKPDLIIINTCSVTAKANIESLGKIRSLQRQFPNAKIIATGCANFEKVKEIKNIFIIKNKEKEKILNKVPKAYTPQIGDKFSHTNRYILKIQSGCTHNCSYCIVPIRRPYLWSLPVNEAIAIVNQAINNGYKEIIISGVNLNQYQYGFSNLIESILTSTSIPLISFGSIPINCVDTNFINLIKKYRPRISSFIHIPIQSGSNKILKLMNRPYTKKTIIEKFRLLKNLRKISFGTDIIVGFPGETDIDFKETASLCKQISFSKIHVFRFSYRINTPITNYYNSIPKLSKHALKERSQKIQKLIKNDTH